MEYFIVFLIMFVFGAVIDSGGFDLSFKKWQTWVVIVLLSALADTSTIIGENECPKGNIQSKETDYILANMEKSDEHLY